jgi:hypothetical protein
VPGLMCFGVVLRLVAVQSAGELPENEALRMLPEALAQAVGLYGAEGSVVLMVVQPGERNAYDQQATSLTNRNDEHVNLPDTYTCIR